MERWAGKVAVVTGASSGIGASIAQQLTEAGLIVIGLARRENRLIQLQSKLADAKGQFHFVRCDVSDLSSIKNAFADIKKHFQKVNVLVNNAGIMRYTQILTEGSENDLEAVINTNFMAAVYCTKEMLSIMKNQEEECHIVGISSIMELMYPRGSRHLNLYISAKTALRAYYDVLQDELAEKKNFRITTLLPGPVKSEIAHAAGNVRADEIMNNPKILMPEDVSQIVTFALASPKHVQISDIVMIPSDYIIA